MTALKTVRVLQLGAEDFSRSVQISDCAEWYYEPVFSTLPEKDFDVAVLDREINKEEFEFLIRFLRAYCLFITEKVSLKKGNVTWQLHIRKMGRRVSEGKLKNLLKEDLPDYFSGSYGERYMPQHMSVAQGFKGAISWRGYEGVDLKGDYGNEMTQIVFWRNTIPVEEDQSIEFWLEYEKEDSVEISLEISVLRFMYSSAPETQKVWTFSENELKDIVYIENKNGRRGHIFVSLKACFVTDYMVNFG